MIIPIYTPYLSKYKKSAIDAIDSEWISNHGIYIEKATNKLKELLGCNYVILMANGTVATHSLFISLKYMYPNINKIYVPNNCYVAVYNCVLMEYELNNMETMHINEDTWNIYDDEEYIKSLEPNSAIVIVHNLGGVVNVDKIKSIRPDIILVEDNCEGLFGKYNDTFTISHKWAFKHDEIGYNYRMPNINAALGCAQLEQLPNKLEKKKKLFDKYKIELSKVKGISIFKKPKNCKSNY